MKFSLSRFAFPGWRYALVGFAVLLIGGYVAFGRDENPGATLTIAPGDFTEQVRVSGTVIAAQDVALGFAANGRIAGTYAKVGTHVYAGAIIAEIENGDLIASLAQKEAALAQAQANLASLISGTRPEEVAVAATAVTSAEAALVASMQSAYTTADDAVHNRADVLFKNPRTLPDLSITVSDVSLESALERDRTALESVLADWGLLVSKLSNGTVASAAIQAQGYLSQAVTFLANANQALNQAVADQNASTATLSTYSTSLATARTNVNAAATTLLSDIADLRSAESTLALKEAGSTDDAIAAQAAAVASAEAEIRSARASLAKTRVVAPFSGTVTRMDAKVGEIASPSISEISLQSDGLFQIETYVPEVAIARVAKGNTATTTLDAYGSDAAFPSVVIAVDPAETVKDGVPTYKTTLAFRQADPRIRSGMTANVTIETGVLHDVIVVPAGTIGLDVVGPYVSAVKDDKIVNQHVTTGGSPALGQTLITAGLSGGDIILYSPQ